MRHAAPPQSRVLVVGGDRVACLGWSQMGVA